MATRRIEKTLESIVEEIGALKDCLSSTGVLPLERFQTALHKHRFASTLKAHPCSWDVSLLKALGSNDMASTMVGLADYPELGVLKTTCRSLRLSVTKAEAARSIPTHLYACGGSSGDVTCLDAAERFNPATGQWEALPPMSVGRLHAVSAVIGDDVYVCGGTAHDRFACSYTNTVERFSANTVLKSGAWTSLAPMHSARGKAIGEVVNGQLFVCGGSLGTSGPQLRSQNSAERFDPRRGTWEILPTMMEARRDAMSGVVAGQLMIVGGSNGDDVLKSAECLHLGKACWKLLPSMSTARQNALSCVLKDHLYVCGGITSEWRDLNIVDSKVVERFSVESDVWEILPPMSVPLNQYFSVCSALADRLYVFGYTMRDRNESVGQCFDPVTGQWQAVPPAPTKRIMPLTGVLSGCLYVSGGHDFEGLRASGDSGADGMDWGSALSSAERFDPATSTWAPLPSMHSKRTLLAKSGAGVLVCLSALDV
jgi:N-acetylneuraminic acid mutarotase